jgi:hypothetical protein
VKYFSQAQIARSCNMRTVISSACDQQAENKITRKKLNTGAAGRVAQVK